MAEVFIVDDSRFMRMMLRKILSSDPEIRVMGEAGDGISALDFIAQKSPEVVTLDLQMPGMDGLTVLARIMKDKPTTRVVVISAFTKAGAEASAEALKQGAVGMVQKPSGTASADIEKMRIELIRTVKDAVNAKLFRDVKITDDVINKTVQLKQDSADPAKVLVVMCASTGGPQEIRKVVAMLNDKMPAAIIIAQQMHSKFTRILMKDLPAQLHESTSLTVNIANEGDVLCNGQVTFAPEESDIVVKKEGEYLVVHKQPVTGVGGSSFDILLKSVAEACGKDAVGVILTGDTTDGVVGIKAIKDSGGKTVVQDPTWGCASPHMAKAVIKSVEVDYVLKLELVAVKVLELISRGGTSG
jgi:two-component system chemotaxis response regulator CheB